MRFTRLFQTLRGGAVAAATVVVLSIAPTHAATKSVDLDAQAANGDESQCDLNVLQSFPVKIENKVTNKAVSDAYTFSWKSAGPGGFSSSVTAGTTGGVGAKWTWTTNQTVYSYTGSTCDTDICFTQTAGTDTISRFCSNACLADGTTVNISRGATAGTVSLTWVGGQGTYTVYRATTSNGVAAPANAIGTTDTLSFTDTPPDTTVYYVVRGVDCNTRKSCVTNAECSAPGDGTCVSRGPFGVPGRSLLATDVTVSAASLTSSLITFFSPPKEVFRVTSSAAPGGIAETSTNSGTAPITVTTPAYPPGCCPANPDVPHQLRCGDTCVDYLNDPQNCGGCGIVCGEGNCCSGGVCSSLCSEGSAWCNEQCADVQNDASNCGACGNACGDGTCCNGGACASLCDEGRTWCDGACADLQTDNDNCGACGNVCGDGACCHDGACASLCAEGQVWCGDHCADLQNDSANCGACGNACGDGTCCNGGTCASLCAEGQVWCGGQCVDLQNDSANCGACGNACGDGTCCNGGTCASVCPAGQVWCGDHCADLQDDSANCGACGNVCGDGTCCNGGTCASVCPAGWAWCNGQCVDLQSDPTSCGACGNVCGAGTCCNSGACVAACPPGRTLCDGMCVDLQNDPHNCGSCGNECGRHDDNECEHGRCERDDLHDPLSDPSPTPATCSAQSTPRAGVCPNPTPANPSPGSCPNATPTSPVAGHCPNPAPTTPMAGYCPTETPSHPVAGVCDNPHPSPGPVPGVCPDPGSTPPPVEETPTCVVPETTQTIPPGGSSTVCNPGGVLFKEVPSTVTVCGDGIPGADGQCNNTTTKVTTGTFNRLVPDTSIAVGAAYLTPYAIHVVSDTSNDGMLEPGESANLVIDVLNAGASDVLQASASLSAPAVDLTQDGVANPVGLSVTGGAAAYGTIFGTPASSNCTPPLLRPASNATVFAVSVPSNHPGDTSHPMSLSFTGTANGAPFSMVVPVNIGIADRCDPAALTRDYDGVDGLASPMAKLVPSGDPVPFPTKSFSAGNTRPMKLRMSCGGVNLTDATVDAPEIVGLSVHRNDGTDQVLDIRALNLNSDNGTNPNDPFFRFNNSISGGQWVYNMRTALIGTGRFTITIRIAGRKEYVTGFVLQ